MCFSTVLSLDSIFPQILHGTFWMWLFWNKLNFKIWSKLKQLNFSPSCESANRFWLIYLSHINHIRTSLDWDSCALLLCAFPNLFPIRTNCSNHISLWKNQKILKILKCWGMLIVSYFLFFSAFLFSFSTWKSSNLWYRRTCFLSVCLLARIFPQSEQITLYESLFFFTVSSWNWPSNDCSCLK